MQIDKNAILSFTGHYDYLSNFYFAPMWYNGREYKTVEHLYQAMKTETEGGHHSIANLPGPGSVKRAGQRVKLRSDWEKIKDSVMLLSLFLKFTQHPALAQLLINTGDVHLEEGNNHGDEYWGTVDGVGKNMLGISLMHTRSVLKGGIYVRRM